MPHPLHREPDERVPQERLGGVKALLHSVFDQIDAAAVHAQYDRLLAQVALFPPSRRLPGRRVAGRARPRLVSSNQGHCAPLAEQREGALGRPLVRRSGDDAAISG